MKNYFLSILVFCLCACEIVDDDINKHTSHEDISLEKVAKLISVLPLEQEQLDEVHRAVSISSGNGYDEEYMMCDLFSLPGRGVGEEIMKSPQTIAAFYQTPLRDLLRDYVNNQRHQTKSNPIEEELIFSETFLEDLENSNLQIYWPYSDNWDGKTMPIVTFDPEDNSDENEAYKLVKNADSTLELEKINVTENMAKEVPVWVINRNSDSDFMSLEMLRKQQPEWGEGGSVIIRSASNQTNNNNKVSDFSNDDKSSVYSKSGNDKDVKTLLLREFTAKRNFDSWLAGASEFFVKVGAVEDFYASTEAELKLYSPAITDFMVVVKRSQVGTPVNFNAVLVSEWSENLTHCAFMIIEDDGGTITQWKCSAVVKVASKSYGFEISLPFNSRDDIVWRGQLSRKYLEENSNITGHFGDIDLVFEIR